MQNKVRILGIGLLLVGLTFVGTVPVARTADAAQQVSLAPFALSLSAIPPRLPADNNTYPAVLVSVVDKNAQPTAALSPIQVLLTSSQENVGTVNGSLTIPSGQTYAVANFTTTNTAGESVVTATTTGMTTGSTTVTTVIAVGYPTHLVTIAIPSTVPARASSSGKLILELEDAVGLPAKAISDVPISLYSSNTNVVNLAAPTTVMRQGSYLLEIDYNSGFIPGSATITASASGFDSGTATVTVIGSPPLELKLFAQPAAMVTCTSNVTSCTGRLVVALTDLSGNPTRAASDIQVQIRSSDLAIVNTVETTTIQAGNISATAIYQVTASAGSARMAASAPGLQSAFTTITTSPAAYVSPSICTTGTSTACALQISAGPDPVLADHRSYSSVVVSLVGEAGSPAINVTGPTRVALTSSVTGVGNFTNVEFSIPEGQNWAAITFTSTFQVGSTQLTASGQNLLPVQTALSTFGPVPSQVVLTAFSGSLPADGQSHPALELSLEDALGSPAIAPFDVPVNLTSSQSSILKVAPVIIPSGQTFAVVNVTSGVLQGKANVTAVESVFTSGYAASSAVLTAVIPAPSAISGFAPNGNRIIWPVTPNNQLPLIALQLEDAAGNPARARAPLNFTVTSSNSTVIPNVLTASIDVGRDYLLLAASPAVPGTTTLTVTSPGLTVATLSVTFLPYPSLATLTGGPANILTSQTSVISVNVALDGAPLGGVSVNWNATDGGLIVATPPPTNSTSATTTTATGTATATRTSTTAAPAGSPSVSDSTAKTGASTVIFRPDKAGSALVTAVVSGSGVQTKTLNFTVLVTAPPPSTVKAKPSIVQELTAFPLVLLPVGGAAGAVVAVFLVRRRGSRGSKSDEEFDSSLE